MMLTGFAAVRTADSASRRLAGTSVPWEPDTSDAPRSYTTLGRTKTAV